MKTFRDDRGGPIQLGTKIAEAGEGRIFALSDGSARLAKIYKEPPSLSKIAKLKRQLVNSPPSVRQIAAWPERLLTEAGTTAVVGFVMERFQGRPIHQLYNPRDRKTHFPKATWKLLCRGALKTGLLVAVKTGK